MCLQAQRHVEGGCAGGGGGVAKWAGELLELDVRTRACQCSFLMQWVVVLGAAITPQVLTEWRKV